MRTCNVASLSFLVFFVSNSPLKKDLCRYMASQAIPIAYLVICSITSVACQVKILLCVACIIVIQ